MPTPNASSEHYWRLVHGWPVKRTKEAKDAFPNFTLPNLRWESVEVWDAGVGGSQYLLVIAHRRALTIGQLATLLEACRAADMWFVLEASFRVDGGVMAVITSFWNEFYS